MKIKSLSLFCFIAAAILLFWMPCIAFFPMINAIERLDSITVEANGEMGTLTSDSNYLYAPVVKSNDAPHLYRIELSTFTLDQSYIDLADINDTLRYVYHSMVIDNYLYLACDTAGSSVGAVVRININSWIAQANDWVEVTDNYPVAIDSYTNSTGTYIYAISNYRLEEISVSTFTLFRTLNLGSLYGWDTREDVEIIGDYAYLFVHKTPFYIEKISLLSWSRVQKYTVSQGNGFGGMGGHIADKDANYFYIAQSSGGGYPDYLTRVTIELDSTEYLEISDLSGQFSCVEIGSGNIVYVGDWSYPARVGEVESFVFNEYVEFVSGEGGSVCLHWVDEFLYSGNAETDAIVTRVGDHPLTAQENISENIEFAAVLMAGFWIVVFFTHIIIVIQTGKSQYFFHLMLGYTVAIIILLVFASVVLTI